MNTMKQKCTSNITKGIVLMMMMIVLIVKYKFNFTAEHCKAVEGDPD